MILRLLRTQQTIVAFDFTVLHNRTDNTPRCGTGPSEDTEYGDKVVEDTDTMHGHNVAENYKDELLNMEKTNTLIDIRAYLVELRDGLVTVYTVNIIAENVHP